MHTQIHICSTRRFKNWHLSSFAFITVCIHVYLYLARSAVWHFFVDSEFISFCVAGNYRTLNSPLSWRTQILGKILMLNNIITVIELLEDLKQNFANKKTLLLV